MPPFAIVIIGVLTVLSVWFVRAFVIRSVELKKALLLLLASLRETKKGDLEGIRRLFEGQHFLQHFWQQYEETLHKQFDFVASEGLRRCVAVRATLPAEAFFSAQNVIEPHIQSELFKHFPGIYTGIGILGTFGGLIMGLKEFRITDDAKVVRESLQYLLSLVSEAFLVSAIAIGLAMILTFIEKWRVESLSSILQNICHEIDRRFMAGVSEEYLERLVKASEESATQAKILKDSLVGDLRQILEDVTDRQIQATAGNPAQIGHHLREAIQANLAEPLTQIAEGISRERQSSSEVLTAALGDILAAFSQRMQDMFGGQVNGIADMQKQTIDSLISAAGQLEKMASNLDHAGQNATDRMADRLIESLDAMSARQKSINDDMSTFVHGIQRIVSESQTESADRLRSMLSDLGGQMAGMVAELRAQAEAATETHRSQQDRLTQSTGTALQTISVEISQSLGLMTAKLGELVADTSAKAERRAAEGDERQQQLLAQTDRSLDGLRTEMEGTFARTAAENKTMLDAVENMLAKNQSAFLSAIKSMEAMLSALHDSGARSADRLNLSVEKLAVASGDFATAGKGVNQALLEAGELARGLEEAARGLERSSGTVTKIVDDHQKARKTLGEMVGALQLVVDAARKEASLTAEALKTIKLSADKLSTAHRDVEDYFDSVSTGLVKVNEEFTKGLQTTIRGANTEFHKQLTTAVGALREGIEELEVTLGRNGTNSPGKR